MQAIAQQRKTVQDYLPLPEGTSCQLLNGAIIIAPAPGRIHQKLTLKLSSLFWQWCENHHSADVYAAPDLIVEILSPGNACYDLRYKLDLYEKFAVQEYFIVDPEDNPVLFYRLEEQYREKNVLRPALLQTEFRF